MVTAVNIELKTYMTASSWIPQFVVENATDQTPRHIALQKLPREVLVFDDEENQDQGDVSGLEDSEEDGEGESEGTGDEDGE